MRMESAPRVGPTVLSSIMVTGAGREPAPQGNGQVLGFIHGKVTGDHCFSSGDPVLNNRSRVDSIVKNDGQALFDVFPGNPFKNMRPFAVEFDAHLGLLELIELHPGIDPAGCRPAIPVF